MSIGAHRVVAWRRDRRRKVDGDGLADAVKTVALEAFLDLVL
jgi:hypothetical protein